MKPRHPLLHRAVRIAFVVFLVVAAALLVRAASAIDWNSVAIAIAGYEGRTLLIAAALTLLSYLVYSGFDVAARSYAHHHLSTRPVMLIAFISYAFSLNIGALVGGTGFRFRLYSHAGLGVGAISRVLIFSVSANWMGYLLLAGGLFAAGGVVVPPDWKIESANLRLFGLAMLAATAAYLITCRLSHGRVFHIRGHHFRFPTLPLALQQLALASTNWSLMAAILYVLMPDPVGYPAVLGTLLVAAVASAIAHIPAGIGVLEAVFVALLGHLAPPPQLLAALLGYRAFYYLAPLMVAVALYLVLEARGGQK
jgi:glycosyltransferase 2 family protein